MFEPISGDIILIGKKEIFALESHSVQGRGIVLVRENLYSYSHQEWRKMPLREALRTPLCVGMPVLLGRIDDRVHSRACEHWALDYQRMAMVPMLEIQTFRSMPVAQKLQYLRENFAITQRQMADLLGVSRQVINSLEYEQAFLFASTIQRLELLAYLYECLVVVGEYPPEWFKTPQPALEGQSPLMKLKKGHVLDVFKTLRAVIPSSPNT